jgi:hypothetical protein
VNVWQVVVRALSLIGTVVSIYWISCGDFQSAWRVRDLRVGPAGSLVTSFGDKLRQDGYAELTARRHLRSAEHLAHWLGGRRALSRELSRAFAVAPFDKYERSNRLVLCSR